MVRIPHTPAPMDGLYTAVFWTGVLLLIPGAQCDIQSQLKQQITALSRLDQQPSSLAFVFDVTSSMNDDLEQVRTATRAILTEITQQEDMPVENFVLVPFHDPRESS